MERRNIGGLPTERILGKSRMSLAAPSRFLTSPSTTKNSEVKATTSLKTFLQFPSRPQYKLERMASQRNIFCSSRTGENGSPSTVLQAVDRVGEMQRVTKETNVQVKINLDGTGISDSNTGIPLLDHMLDGK